MKSNLELLANANFVSFLFFRTTMVLSLQMVTTIAHWQVYTITRDPLWIGYLALAEVIPAIALSLPGGYWADSFNRRRIALCGLAVAALSGAILTGFSLRREIDQLSPLFAAIGAIGIGRGILAPASTALYGEIVARHYYARAAVFSSIGWHIAMIAGPALAGIVYEKWGSLAAYRTALLLSLFSWTSLWLIRAPGRPNSARESIRRALSEGLRFVGKNRIILGAMSLDMFAVLFGGAVALLPAFSDQIYKTGAEGLGYLRAAPAVGAAIMGVILVFLPIRHHAGRVLLGAVAAFGITMIAFAITRDFYTALFILAVSGGVDNISVVLRSTILQTHTPDAMRGRVAAVNSIFIASSNELGAFESGVAARLLGLVPSVIFGGTVTIVVVLLIAIFVPELRRLSFADSQK
ncbi:MAG: MFS transporter [Leptospiraceae bacterium]|nr:MFS transporter [Leptospiraceae bacterium]